jgi:hypothetical protein
MTMVRAPTLLSLDDSLGLESQYAVRRGLDVVTVQLAKLVNGLRLVASVEPAARSGEAQVTRGDRSF